MYVGRTPIERHSLRRTVVLYRGLTVCAYVCIVFVHTHTKACTHTRYLLFKVSIPPNRLFCGLPGLCPGVKLVDGLCRLLNSPR